MMCGCYNLGTPVIWQTLGGRAPMCEHSRGSFSLSLQRENKTHQTTPIPSPQQFVQPTSYPREENQSPRFVEVSKRNQDSGNLIQQSVSLCLGFCIQQQSGTCFRENWSSSPSTRHSFYFSYWSFEMHFVHPIRYALKINNMGIVITMIIHNPYTEGHRHHHQLKQGQ